MSDIIGGTSLYSTKSKEIFKRAYNHTSDSILNTICSNEISILSADDSRDFFEQLNEMIITNPEDKKGYNVYLFCIENRIEGTYTKFLNILKRIDVKKIPFSLGNKFNDVLKKYPDKELLEVISKNKNLSKIKIQY